MPIQALSAANRFPVLIYLRSGIESTPFDQFRNLVFPFDGHNVESVHALHFLEALDGLDADVEPFLGLLLLRDAAHALDDLVGHIHARHPVLHVLGHAGRFHGGEARQDVDLFVKAPVPDTLHPFLELVEVVDALRLDELGAGGDLLGQARDTDLEGVGERVRRGPHEHAGRTLDLVAAEELAFVAHPAHGLDELHRVDVEDVLARRAVPEGLVVARQAEHIEDVEGGGPQDVALEGDPVAVPHDHLQDGLEAHELDVDAGCQAAQPRDRCLVVGDVDGVDMILDHLGLPGDRLGIAPARGAAFGCDGEMPGCQDLFQLAGCLQGSHSAHSLTSSLTTVLGPPARSVDQSLMGARIS
ncbi:hypothetical protein TRIP_B330260 [uncultured Desulfatiglans sp.]|uniref:Uncharacterized protein n=1 Tax=Uncultured Desulfatiglans sp. TaxID=1748965 RepID=A0A653A7N6_UNCDX|nr:hypothetical protein TRIP_B330260 [uncultured Desulfatiglans sp.]